MEKKNWSIIKCNHCGAEFHPSEIYLPGDLTGTPKSNGLIKDPTGRILYVDYKEDEEPALVQTFTCPECGKMFLVEATVNYKVKDLPEELNFNDNSVSLL